MAETQAAGGHIGQQGLPSDKLLCKIYSLLAISGRCRCRSAQEDHLEDLQGLH